MSQDQAELEDVLKRFWTEGYRAAIQTVWEVADEARDEKMSAVIRMVAVILEETAL